MEFLILGPLEVRNGQHTLRLGAAKQRALLGVLLLHANETVSTEHLVDELWGGRPPATAEKLVHGYVHALRKQLGTEILQTQAPGYRLRLDPRALDLLEFERLAREARIAELAESVELRREALALWRGPPLADVVLEGAERHTLARLNESQLTTQIEQMDAELEIGRHARLVGELESLVAAHPYQERLHAQLMLALYRSGRQTEALHAYRAFQRVLSDELGLQPSQELRALESAILRQDEELRAPARVDAVAAATRTIPADGASSAGSARHGKPRRARVLRAGAALGFIGIAIALAMLTLRDDKPPVVAPPNSVAVIDIGTNRVEETVAVGIRPGPVAYGEGAVWVGNLEDRTLSRIDPATRKVVKYIQLPATPDAVAVGEEAVWVVNGRLGTLYRVDPTLNLVTDAVRLGDRAIMFTSAGVAVGAGSVWAAFGDSTLARARPDPPRSSGLTSAGAGPWAVVVAFGSVWVSNSGDSTVQRFSPVTFEEGPISDFTVGAMPTGLAAGEGAIWVASTDDDYVTRLDAAGLGHSPARSIPVGDGPTVVAIGGGAVWVANAAGGSVSRLDPETNEVDATIPVGNVPSGMAVVEDSVWVSVQAP